MYLMFAKTAVRSSQVLFVFEYKFVQPRFLYEQTVFLSDLVASFFCASYETI